MRFCIRLARALACVGITLATVQVSAQPSAAGGTGIGFNVQRGRYTVAQITPGSPGDRADIPLGAVLLAIDGDSIEGMSREEIGEAIRGRVGSRVTLTLEIEGEVVDVRLRRADLSKLPPPDEGNGSDPGDDAAPARPRTRTGPDNPPRPEPRRQTAPDPALRDLASMLGDLQLILGLTPEELASYPAPDFLRPGLRLTYESFLSTTRNDFQALPDLAQTLDIPHGNVPVGNVSIAACDVVAVEGGVAMMVRTDYNFDPSAGVFTGASNPYTHVGPAASLQDYWIHPDILATLEQRTDLPIHRGPYEVNGETYEVALIRAETREFLVYWMFDTKTGLLLVLRTGHLGGRYNLGNRNNPLPDEFDHLTRSQLRFHSAREIDWPGLEGRMPEWVQPDRRMTYRGNDYFITDGQALPGGERATQYVFSHAADTIGLGALRALPTAASPDPLDQPLVMGSGIAGIITGFAIPDAAFRQARAGAVIDRCPITGAEIVVAAKDAQFVTFEHRHAAFVQRRVFDRDGRLVQAENFTPQPTGGQGWIMNLVGFE